MLLFIMEIHFAFAKTFSFFNKIGYDLVEIVEA